MHKVRNFPEFTHFACLPFVQHCQREIIKNLQQKIGSALSTKYSANQFSQSNYNLAHITICMLILHRQQSRKEVSAIFEKLSPEIKKNLWKTVLTFNKIGYFTRLNNKTKKQEVTLIYLQIEKDEHYSKIQWLQDLFIRQMMKAEIIVSKQLKQMRIRYDHNANKYRNEENHLTLFRIKNIQRNEDFLHLFQSVSELQKKISFDCSCFDISTRSNYDENMFYKPFAQIQFNSSQKEQDIKEIES